MKPTRALALLVLVTCAFCATASHNPSRNASMQHRGNLVVLIKSKNHAVSFIPSQAFGAGVDGHGHGEVGRLFSPSYIQRMLGAGLQRVSYRLRSEIAIHAWHWNPEGRWSNPARHEGYWTSDSDSASPILV